MATPPGDPFTENSFDDALKAAHLILVANRDQIRLLQVGEPQGGKDGQAQVNVLAWMQRVWPGVNKMLQEFEKAEGFEQSPSLPLRSPVKATAFKKLRVASPLPHRLRKRERDSL
jgi:hypothetical protein